MRPLGTSVAAGCETVQNFFASFVAPDRRLGSPCALACAAGPRNARRPTHRVGRLVRKPRNRWLSDRPTAPRSRSAASRGRCGRRPVPRTATPGGCRRNCAHRRRTSPADRSRFPRSENSPGGSSPDRPIWAAPAPRRDQDRNGSDVAVRIAASEHVAVHRVASGERRGGQSHRYRGTRGGRRRKDHCVTGSPSCAACCRRRSTATDAG